MELTINNQTTNFENAPSALEVAQFWQPSSSLKGVAIAVNNRVIPQSEWETIRLKEQDDILIITATQGG